MPPPYPCTIFLDRLCSHIFQLNHIPATQAYPNNLFALQTSTVYFTITNLNITFGNVRENPTSMLATPATAFNSKHVQCRHHHKHFFRHQIPTTHDSHFTQLQHNETISSTGRSPDTLSLLPDQNHPPGNHQRAIHPDACIPISVYIFIFNNSRSYNIHHQHPTARTNTRSTQSSVPCDPPITQILGQPFDSLSALYSAIPPFKNTQYKAI